jgi:hypothetical protein
MLFKIMFKEELKLNILKLALKKLFLLKMFFHQLSIRIFNFEITSKVNSVNKK